MNVKINHYASVVMEAVPEYNDMVGGVSLTVLDDFSAIDETLVKGETVTLSGAQALTYVRARKGMEDSSNIARMERQRQYLQVLYEMTKQCVSQDDNFVVKATTSLSKYIVSDCTVHRLQELMKKATTYKEGEMLKLEGESVKSEAYIEFYPDKASIEEMIVNLYYTPKEQ
jgi:anionic cell wall polymer biosynthesis LytR-Cps2A-Psr (LCP) family protein